MKTSLSLIPLLTLLCAVAFASPKKNVAIYMAGTEPIKGSHKVLSAELAKVLTKSDAYTAVDRSEAGRKIVAQEHIFQRSGAVEKNQVKKLGKQLGVQIVCIAEITEVMKSHYLEARLVDVETAEVFNIASEPGNMSGAPDIVRTAKAVAQELLGVPKIVKYSFKEIETNPDMAIEDYTEAIQQEPNVAEYYFKRSYAYRIKKDYYRAISDLTEAIRLNPNDAMLYNNRGVAYYEKRDYDRAISDYNEAIRLNPNYAEAYSNRGAVYYNNDNYDKAISEVNEAIRLNPNFTHAYDSRAYAYHDKGDYDKAISDYTQAIRLNPEAFRYSSRGYAYEKKGDYDRAIADYTQAIRLDPNNALRYIHRGDVYVIKKDYSKAKADYESALRIDPSNFNIDFMARNNLRKIEEVMKK